MSVASKNSPTQGYTHSDDKHVHCIPPAIKMTPGFKPFTQHCGVKSNTNVHVIIKI